jgi:hypothetical protein
MQKKGEGWEEMTGWLNNKDVKAILEKQSEGDKGSKSMKEETNDSVTSDRQCTSTITTHLLLAKSFQNAVNTANKFVSFKQCKYKTVQLLCTDQLLYN